MNIKAKTFEHSLRVLRALGAKYIIVNAEGEQHTHGDLQLAEPKRKKSVQPREHPRGTYVKLVKSSGIHRLQVGDVLTIDPEALRVESVRSTAINLSNDMWGAGSVTTSVTGGKVEVFRVS